VVVDKNINVQNVSEVLWRIGNNVDPRRDVAILEGPLDALDHASPLAFYGGKMGIDATKKGPEDGHYREWPGTLHMDEGVKAKVDALWSQLGL
jgi:3-polyprenyl-4-hydroxybenzoate decarboxylase and related decarboxylases